MFYITAILNRNALHKKNIFPEINKFLKNFVRPCGYESQLLVNHLHTCLQNAGGGWEEKCNKLCAFSAKLNYNSELWMMLGK